MTDTFDILPDPDPSLTEEWIDSADALLKNVPIEQARFVLAAAASHASRQIADFLRTSANDIPAHRQAEYPGDLGIESRIEAKVRWNAMALVHRANEASPGLGGHLSTFASSATLLEVLRNHHLRGHDHPEGADRVFFQGHASPGVYSRAFLEGRLSAAHLDRFRREATHEEGLSSYPHPRLMPDFWEQPTVSMGLGPLTAIHSALMDRYLFDRGLIKHLPRTFAIIGDGETDEPETLGAITLASREKLENLVFIVVCNLQRLDGPVRGYASIVTELAGLFRGASWRVIRSLWGSSWDALFASPDSHLLASRLSDISDGDLQRLTASPVPPTLRSELTLEDPALLALLSPYSDDALHAMLKDRAGHDPLKVHAALVEATSPDPMNRPSVVLLLCQKGHLLPEVESRNAAHQVKGLSASQLTELAARLGLDHSGDLPEYVELTPEEAAYVASRLEASGGPLPRRLASSSLPILANPSVLEEFDAGSTQAVSTTVAHTRLLRLLCRDDSLGERVVPVVADEGRTFGFEPLYAEFGVHAPGTYKGVDSHLPLAYKENTAGKFLQSGISESGALASLTAAGLWQYRGCALLPIYEFYSMFGFQRVADLIWAAVDAGASGVLAGATAGRTTLHGEGLQHADGHSMLWAQSVPALWAYDPAFAFETADVYMSLIEKLATGSSQLLYLTLYNENFIQPSRPANVSREDVMSGMYVFDEAAERLGSHVALCFSGSSYLAALEARELLKEYGVSSDLVSIPGQKRIVEECRQALRDRRLGRPAFATRFEEVLKDRGPAVYVSDWVSALLAPAAPLAPHGFTMLGTDGFGRSSTREELRAFFETDAKYVALAALAAVGDKDVAQAAARWNVNPSSTPSWER